MSFYFTFIIIGLFYVLTILFILVSCLLNNEKLKIKSWKNKEKMIK